ncbi:MAG: DUF6713 family protein [Raoultibacter sp.]|jgi:hypothetical protein
MEEIMLVIFLLGLTLLLVHEMDAIKSKEWKMFIGLRSLSDEIGYRVFALIHVPLYLLVFFLLLSPYQLIGFYLVDAFLVIHGLIHIVFRSHKENRFTSFSSILIYGGALCGLLHLLYLAFF